MEVRPDEAELILAIDEKGHKNIEHTSYSDNPKVVDS
jgi:hypothetical protein